MSLVEPIYIAGRLRTASRPSRTVIDAAPYSCVFVLTEFLFFVAGFEARPSVVRKAGTRKYAGPSFAVCFCTRSFADLPAFACLRTDVTFLFSFCFLIALTRFVI